MRQDSVADRRKGWLPCRSRVLHTRKTGAAIGGAVVYCAAVGIVPETFFFSICFILIVIRNYGTLLYSVILSPFQFHASCMSVIP